MSAPLAPAPRRVRHALGLPAGSIRSILAFGILGMSWALALLYRDNKLPMVFVYLQLLTMLILAHFFAAHGNSMSVADTTGPLYLPGSWIRFLLMAGYAGIAYFLFVKQPEFQVPPAGDWLVMMALILTAFFLGHVFTMTIKLFNGGILPPWYQDVEAWLAMMAIFTMIILVFCYVINAGLEKSVDTPTLDSILAAIVGFYFGSRS